MNFYDGMQYMLTILLSELTVDQGHNLENVILEDLSRLVYNYCQDCQAKLPEPDESQVVK